MLPAWLDLVCVRSPASALTPQEVFMSRRLSSVLVACIAMLIATTLAAQEVVLPGDGVTLPRVIREVKPYFRDLVRASEHRAT